MPASSDLKQEFIQDFGRGYENFGFSTLMGRVVGLLLCEERGPLSLDDIAEALQVSKGPVSQITRRLAENGLIRKVWIAGSRRDHYAAEDGIFLRAFASHAALLAENRALAEKYNEAHSDEVGDGQFRWRVREMLRFYELMGEHLQRFMDDWLVERRHLAKTWNETSDSDHRSQGDKGA